MWHKERKMGRLVERFQPVSPVNSIAFGSAPRREADSQPINQLARPAVSQTETHSLGFLSVAHTAPNKGEEECPQGRRWPNCNAANCRHLVGGSNPGRAKTAAASAAAVNRPGFEPPT